MTISRDDRKRLLVPAVAAVLMVGIGAGCLVASEFYLGTARSDREAAKVRRVQAETRVARAAEEEREIREQLAAYRRLEESGVIGQENRLDMIETIARIKQDRRLQEIKYTIEPQKPLLIAGMKPSQPLAFYASRMKLDMLLLHEEDLTRFLSDLYGIRNSLVSVRRCDLARLTQGPVPIQSLAPRLRSQCEIDLIVVR
ncbi:MAG: hypothetical protein IT514_06150 [Burkholderiales bacterium]|nr:hypothetical protein [Burkholderiales bacterium]